MVEGIYMVLTTMALGFVGVIAAVAVLMSVVVGQIDPRVIWAVAGLLSAWAIAIGGYVYFAAPTGRSRLRGDS